MSDPLPSAPAAPAADQLPCAARQPAKEVSAFGRLIRQLELFERMAVSKASGYRLAAAGKIGPRPIRLSGQLVRYDLAEVIAWLGCRRPDGRLHDARSWQAVWEALQRGNGNSRTR